MDSSNKFIFKLVDATAGHFRQYRITFWSQLVLGFLYSFGHFDSSVAGFVLGYALPVFWVILTYRYIYTKTRENVNMPFPAWMKRNPGNILVILVDIAFLSFVWLLILSEVYDPVWIKVLFTMVFPLLTLSMLRNLVVYPVQSGEGQEVNQDKQQKV